MAKHWETTCQFKCNKRTVSWSAGVVCIEGEEYKVPAGNTGYLKGKSTVVFHEPSKSIRLDVEGIEMAIVGLKKDGSVMLLEKKQNPLPKQVVLGRPLGFDETICSKGS